MNNQDALTTLNDYLASQGSDTSSSTLDSWDITPYKEAFVFSSKDARSNNLYIVKGAIVSSFSPATTTLDEVYEQIAKDHDS